MSENTTFRVFDEQLDRLTEPPLADLAVRLRRLKGLAEDELVVVEQSAKDALLSILNLRLSRVFLLELNAARVEGRLSGSTSQDRWHDFMDFAKEEKFWNFCFNEYPALRSRLEILICNACNAALETVRHWIEDRKQLSLFLCQNVGQIRKISFAAGDRHRDGRAVAILECDAGPVVYKPRSLKIDSALHGFAHAINGKLDAPLRLGVPQVLCVNDHGWARFVEHRFVQDDERLAHFYYGIGQTLALMRLLGGTDFHAENLIASDGVPVLVDCETLFTPNISPFASDYGDAFDQGISMASGGVLAIGLLPERGQGLGWRGIDMSGIGGLSDQQPETMAPGLVDEGLDTARVEMVASRNPLSKNHPAREPAISRFWTSVVDGFADLTKALRRIDEDDELVGLISKFEGSEIRVVVRTTEMYAELERMLWHPVSLKDEASARTRAFEILSEMASNISYAPDDPEVINAEIKALCTGDIPLFSTKVEHGRLTGPGGYQWLAETNLIDATLADWRGANLEAEQGFIRSAIVSAYVNDGVLRDGDSMWPKQPDETDLDQRRRDYAENIVRELCDTALVGADNTIGWVAPSLTQAGWSVAPLGPDLYAGLSGIALLTGGYLQEQEAGRANPIAGLDEVFTRLSRTLQLCERRQARDRDNARELRPPPVGGFVGLGSQIWTLLVLSEMDIEGDGLVERAEALAKLVPWAADADESVDMLYGSSGVIVPLIYLARISGNDEYLKLATRLGERICERAVVECETAHWPVENITTGLGGFAHGVTGIGWALLHLAEATGNERIAKTASAAFAYEEGLFDDSIGNWLDLRQLEGVTSTIAWCHGAVGIGLAHLEMDPEMRLPVTRTIVRRSATITEQDGFGWNHCLCHGDAGGLDLFANEVVQREISPKLNRQTYLAKLLTSLDQHGPTCGVVGDAFVPSLFTGRGGLAYQLLRAHPDCNLPSPLTPGMAA